MKGMRLFALVVAFLLLLPVIPAPADAPSPGDKAPDFTLQGSDGQRYTLGQFVGERGLVLAWFPKAFTPG
jgi:peroxiredoxin Q/BCP